MRSSAKITLFLGPSPTAAASSSPTSGPASDTASGGGGTWTCGVCGMVNSLASHETSPSPSAKCVLCGVAYSASRTSAIPPSRVGTPGPPGSGSRESDKPGKAAPDVSNAQSTEGADDGIACPACTFLNHKSMTACEICSTPLPRKAGVGFGAGQGAQGVVTPVGGGSGGVDVGSSGGDRLEVVRLSFRKGGEKEAYRKLKSVLTTKAWETEVSAWFKSPLSLVYFDCQICVLMRSDEQCQERSQARYFVRRGTSVPPSRSRHRYVIQHHER